MVLAVLPQHRPVTVDERDALPEDGLRYELIDGEILVSPSPTGPHQRVVRNLTLLLTPGLPPGYEVLTAPFDWYVDPFTVFVPDLLVLRHEDADARRLERPPLLAVEVLSPSTRRRDLGLKRRAYEAAGLPLYWVVDAEEPRLLVLRLRDGRLVEESTVTGDESYECVDPLVATVVPGALIKPA